MGLLLKLVRKLGLVGKVLPALFKGIAEGKFGPQAQAIYWKVSGFKTITGAALWLACDGLEIFAQTGSCPDCLTWLGYVRSVAAFLVFVGLADAAVREVPPAPPVNAGK